MISRPDILMIGATGRNVGKTEFACELIKRYAPSVPVTAVKITAISETGGVCPRGGAGCGVCTSVEGRFSITEERDAAAAKDTSRMLRAGAHRVLWLRVLRAHLREGVEALLAGIPEGGLIVCESNTARRVIQPGLFLMIRPQGAAPVKPSAGELMPLADRVIEFTGAGWDLPPERCRFLEGSWTLAFDATAVILAGGQSRRMGQDKSLMSVGGEPLISRIAGQLAPHFPELLVSSNDPWKYNFLGLPVVPDEVPGQGPLRGILSCLKAAGQERVLVIACDIPVVDLAFVRELIACSDRADIVMPLSKDGLYEPLFAVYRKTVIPRAEAVLARGGRRIVEVLPGMNVLNPRMPEGWYYNLNTQADYDAFWQASLARHA